MKHSETDKVAEAIGESLGRGSMMNLHGSIYVFPLGCIGEVGAHDEGQQTIDDHTLGLQAPPF